MNRRSFLKSMVGLAAIPFIPTGIFGDDPAMEGIHWPKDGDGKSVDWIVADEVSHRSVGFQVLAQERMKAKDGSTVTIITDWKYIGAENV